MLLFPRYLTYQKFGTIRDRIGGMRRQRQERRLMASVENNAGVIILKICFTNVI